MCLSNKTVFKSLEAATERANEINLRAYKCKYCYNYHLTSKTKQEFANNLNKKITLISTRVKKREQSFIFRESLFWEKKFGININN